MHDYHESKTVLTINDNHEFKGENVLDNWNDNLQSLNQEKMKHQRQSFTRIGRQFQSLKRQVYAVWTSVSSPLCQRSCLIWRIMTNTLTNIYIVIFLSASFFGRSYHSRYQNFEFTDPKFTPVTSQPPCFWGHSAAESTISRYIV